jgi:O-antigen ligase
MDREISGLEKAYTVAVLLYFTGAFFRTFHEVRDPTAGASTGNFAANLIWACIYLSSAWLVTTRCSLSRAFLHRLWPLFLLYSVVLLSVIWSDAPKVSFLRLGALVGSTLFGLYFGTRYPLKMQLVLLGWTFGMAAVLSVIFSLLFPDYSIGTGPFEGMWLGIYEHKNALGMNMAIGFTVFLVLSHCYPARRWRFRALALASVIVILFADSATSLVECIVMSWVFLLVKTLQPWTKVTRLRAWFVAGSGLLLCASPFLFYEKIVAALGRDVELTGRLVVWGLVWDNITQRPLLGYGYFAFWRGVDGPLGYLISIADGSGNGLLDLLSELGLLGLVAFLIVYVVFVRRSFIALREWRIPEAIWPLFFLAWLPVVDITEDAILRPNQVPWVLFIAVATALSAHGRDFVADRAQAIGYVPEAKFGHFQGQE